jgi:hypothetical protein
MVNQTLCFLVDSQESTESFEGEFSTAILEMKITDNNTRLYFNLHLCVYICIHTFVFIQQV